MGILQLISTRNYISVNKELIKILGLEETILLGELASEYDYWEKQDKLEEGYFFSTVENIEENTTLSAHKQRKGLEKLKELGLIDIKIKGMPAKRYIKIYEEQVVKYLNIKLLKNLTTSCEKIEQLDVKNFNGNNNIYNNNINNNINSTRFKKPTIDEVKEYCIERKNNIDAERFIDYYEANGWKVGKNSMKNWKATVRTWEKNNFNNTEKKIPNKLNQTTDVDFSKFYTN